MLKMCFTVLKVKQKQELQRKYWVTDTRGRGGMIDLEQEAGASRGKEPSARPGGASVLTKKGWDRLFCSRARALASLGLHGTKGAASMWTRTSAGEAAAQAGRAAFPRGPLATALTSGACVCPPWRRESGDWDTCATQGSRHNLLCFQKMECKLA